MSSARKRLTIDIDERLHRRLKARAALEGRSVREYCVRALERELGTGDEQEPSGFTDTAFERLAETRKRIFGDRVLPDDSTESLREIRAERSRQSDEW